MRNNSLTIKLIFLMFSVSLTLKISAAPQVLKYTYDVLGRATFVEDSVNGTRDFDYDKAGNRTAVNIGQTQDEPPVVPPPAAPTNARCASVGPGGWLASWNAVPNINFYVVRFTNEQEYTLTNTSMSANFSCRWVKACVSATVCSAKTNF